MQVDRADALHQLGVLVAQMKGSGDILLASTRGNIDRQAIDYHAGMIATGILACEFWLILAETGGRLSENTKWVSTNFHHEFTRCAAAFRKLANREKITLTIRHDGNPVRFIGTHPAALQIPFILIDNAVKYAATGGVGAIELAQTAKGLGISVWNDGPFVTADQILKIVSDGGRGEHAIEAKIPGSGLGLCLLNRIVAVAGGTMKVICQPLDGQVDDIQLGEFSVAIWLPDLSVY